MINYSIAMYYNLTWFRHPKQGMLVYMHASISTEIPNCSYSSRSNIGFQSKAIYLPTFNTSRIVPRYALECTTDVLYFKIFLGRDPLGSIAFT